MIEPVDVITKEKLNNGLVKRMHERKWDEVRSLISAGANPNHQFTDDNKTITVLMYAINCYAFDIATILVERGANPSLKSYSNCKGRLSTPLETASYIENDLRTEDLIRALIKSGADINEISDIGFTALSHAVLHGKNRMVDNLIGLGAKLTVGCKFEGNAIHVAKEQENDEMVAKLEYVELQHAASSVRASGVIDQPPSKRVRL